MAWTADLLVPTELACASNGGLEAADAAPHGGSGGELRGTAMGTKEVGARGHEEDEAGWDGVVQTGLVQG
jgi:hypothetical protein